MSKVYLALDDINNSILYLCRALITKDKPEMKVNLYEQMGNLLESLSEDEMALKHYLYSKQIRDKNDWNLSSVLENKIINISNKFNTNIIFKEYELREYWNSKLIKLLGEKNGIISNIVGEGKAGFIKTNDGSYYFKMNSTVGKKDLFTVGSSVRFCIVDSYNVAKRQYSKEAICILPMNRKK